MSLRNEPNRFRSVTAKSFIDRNWTFYQSHWRSSPNNNKLKRHSMSLYFHWAASGSASCRHRPPSEQMPHIICKHPICLRQAAEPRLPEFGVGVNSVWFALVMWNREPAAVMQSSLTTSQESEPDGVLGWDLQSQIFKVPQRLHCKSASWSLGFRSESRTNFWIIIG